MVMRRIGRARRKILQVLEQPTVRPPRLSVDAEGVLALDQARHDAHPGTA